MNFEQVEGMGDAGGARRGQPSEVPPPDALGPLGALRHGVTVAKRSVDGR